MIIYLIAIGHPLSMIATARIVRSIIELARTVVVPRKIPLISPGTVNPLAAFSRVALGGLPRQPSCLIPATITLFLLA